MAIEPAAPRRQRWLLFTLGGALNTGISYGLYWVLSNVLQYQVAYLIAYVVGVLISYWFNASLVFHTPLSWRGLFTYPWVYVAQYVTSAVLLAGLVEVVGLHRGWAPLLVTVAMVPVTYLLTRAVLLGRGTRQPPPARELESP